MVMNIMNASNEHIKNQKNLILSFKALSMKYEMYYTNRQYKDSYFKDEETYKLIQKKISLEIETEEKNIKDIIINFLKKNFSNVKFIAYDSRLVCFTDSKQKLGNILISNSNELEAELIMKQFKEEFNVDLKVELLENLPKELQEKFK